MTVTGWGVDPRYKVELAKEKRSPIKTWWKNTRDLKQGRGTARLLAKVINLFQRDLLDFTADYSHDERLLYIKIPDDLCFFSYFVEGSRRKNPTPLKFKKKTSKSREKTPKIEVTPSEKFSKKKMDKKIDVGNPNNPPPPGDSSRDLLIPRRSRFAL